MQGSVWNKWDLHLHTPSSYDYNNGSVTNEDIINKLISDKIAVAAITDHHIIDVARINELIRIADNRVTILPAIEFRSELGGKEPIHFIGIFDNGDIQNIWEKIKVKAELNASDIKSKGGNEGVYCKFQEIAKLIHSLGGVVCCHAGNKSNGIESLPNSEYFRQIQKKDLINDSIDIFEVNRRKDVEDYKKIVFPAIKNSVAIVKGSDNHNINEYSFGNTCWIKAKPNFQGLKQALLEWEHRIIIDEYPEKLRIVENNKTKYIRQISVLKDKNSKLNEKWFNNTIILNHDLVAIIGNKGNGKSALADIIALVGDSHVRPLTFLTENKFCSKKVNKGRSFFAELIWENNETVTRGLGDLSSDESKVERVKYIPQNYFETLCNDLEDEKVFDNEIKRVIFSHVPKEEQYNNSNLDDIIKNKTERIYDAISLIKSDMKPRVDALGVLCSKKDKNYSNNIKYQLELKQKELEAILKEKPQEVAPPQTDETEKQKNIKVQLTLLNSQQILYEQNLKEYQLHLEKVNIEINDLNNLTLRLRNAETYINSFSLEARELCKNLNLSFESIFKYTINMEPIAQKKEELIQQKNNITYQLNEGNLDSIIFKAKVTKENIAELNNELNEEEQIYQNYLNSLAVWQKNVAQIKGTENEIGTITNLDSELNKIKNIDNAIDQSKKEILNYTKKIFELYEQIVEEYKLLYSPVQKFIESTLIGTDKNIMSFEATINEYGFIDDYQKFINSKAKGYFRGIEDGRNRLNDAISSFDFNDKTKTIEFIKRVFKETIELNDGYILSQIRNDYTIQDILEYLFELEYLMPKYELRMANRSLSELSPGEKGALLLLFYLFVDKSEIPLIIDQPEENLDNETVYNLLVGYIKEAKKRRQIIIVTHNANLAVVCDAEQIIYSQIDKANGNKVYYTCGAIEDQNIKDKVINVLEGTKPAFINRESKYAFIRPN